MDDKKLVYDLKHVGIYYQRVGSLPWKKNKFWALRDLTFSIRKGETIGVIGKNGAGKSTLLRLLAGIISADRGVFHSEASSCALLSLGAGFNHRLTGEQNIFLNGLLLGMSKARIKEKKAAIIELADIGSAIKEPVRTYSTGMRSRLGFAIAFYVESEVLLLDEVLAPGDEEFRKKATKMIKDKIRSDHTAILATHSLSLVEELCDRVIQIRNGQSLEELSIPLTLQRYREEC